jgi:hypothetical protein
MCVSGDIGVKGIYHTRTPALYIHIHTYTPQYVPKEVCGLGVDLRQVLPDEHAGAEPGGHGANHAQAVVGQPVSELRTGHARTHAHTTTCNCRTKE